MHNDLTFLRHEQRTDHDGVFTIAYYWHAGLKREFWFYVH